MLPFLEKFVFTQYPASHEEKRGLKNGSNDFNEKQGLEAF